MTDALGGKCWKPNCACKYRALDGHYCNKRCSCGGGRHEGSDYHGGDHGHSDGKKKSEKKKSHKKKSHKKKSDKGHGCGCDKKEKSDKGSDHGHGHDQKNETVRTFKVTLVSKEGVSGAGRATDGAYVFSVDGKAKCNITLIRGHHYRFELDFHKDGYGCYENAFYLTRDSLGGPRGEAASPKYDPVKLDGTPDPASTGYFYFSPDENTPSFFYYNCRKMKGMGGMVIVKDRKADGGRVSSYSEYSNHS